MTHRKHANPAPDFIRARRTSENQPAWDQYDVWLRQDQINLIRTALGFLEAHEEHYVGESELDRIEDQFREAQGGDFLHEWKDHQDNYGSVLYGIRGTKQ